MLSLLVMLVISRYSRFRWVNAGASLTAYAAQPCLRLAVSYTLHFAHQPLYLQNLAMLTQMHKEVSGQPMSLSHLQLPRQPNRLNAPSQQFVRQNKGRTNGKRCCTYAAQSMVDALGGKGQSVPQRAWWNDHQELWAAVHTQQELETELKGNGKELVVVGMWCVRRLVIQESQLWSRFW